MLGALPPQSDVPTVGRRGRGFVTVVLVVVALAGGVLIGKSLSGGSVFRASSESGLDFSLFDEVFGRIQTDYVEPLEATAELEYGAIKGLVAGLGDPNSNFMDPDETKAFQQNLDGRFSGIGVELATRDGQLTVVAPLEGSPGEREGLQPGDVILAIDGQDTATLTLDESVQRIRGEIGTEVTLVVSRAGEFDADTFTITREEISIESVKYEVREDGIGVLQIARFGEDTAAKVAAAGRDFLSRKVKGIVLDLRGNPGGFLESSVDVAGNFIEDGVVVSEEFNDGTKQEYRAQGNAQLKGIPLVVLVDEGSASAAEILAGALRDYGLAKLVGAKTFGKGSVQELSSLSKGTSLRLTVAKWLLPKGDQIDHVGIEPDVPVELTREDVEAGRDPQLDKALELL